MANDNCIVPSLVSNLLHNFSFSRSLYLRRQEPSEGDIYLPTTTPQSTNLTAMDLHLSSLLFRQRCQRPPSQALNPTLTHPPGTALLLPACISPAPSAPPPKLTHLHQHRKEL